MPMLTSGRSRFIGGSRVPPTPVPVAGAELLTNGGFETGDITGWTNASVGTGAPDASSGACVLVQIDGSNYAKITQAITTAGRWYIATGNVSITGGGVGAFARACGEVIGPIPSAAGLIKTAQAVTTTVQWQPGNATSPVSLDNLSVKQLTLSSLISTRPYASADCDISVAVTRTAGTQAGISARVDSTSSPANFLIAYLDGAGNVKVDKAVAGVYTNVISGAVTYGAGYILRLVCNGNNVSVYYNGTQVGSTTAVSDAGIVGNKNHGLFSTYASNAFSGYTAA